MKLSEPKVITFIIAVVLGVVGILATYIEIPVISGIAFLLLVAGFVLLVIANLVKGL